MSLLIFALVIVIVAALVIWAVSLIPMDSRLSLIVQVAIILIAALVICQRAGLV